MLEFCYTLPLSLSLSLSESSRVCGESLSRCVEAADEKEVRGGGDGQEGGGEGGAAAKLFSYPRHYDETEPDAKMRTPNTELTLGTEKRKKTGN